jgi:hypothetical protein
MHYRPVAANPQRDLATATILADRIIEDHRIAIWRYSPRAQSQSLKPSSSGSVPQLLSI